MGGEPVVNLPYTNGEQFGAIALVIFLSAVGGLLLGSLNGFQLPNFKPFNGKKVPAILGKVHIPPIIAMIVMGCVVRNTFGQVVKPYNS